MPSTPIKPAMHPASSSRVCWRALLRNAIAEVLREQGLTPVDIRETQSKAAKSSSGLNVTLFRQKVSHIDLLLFSRQIHTLLKIRRADHARLEWFAGCGDQSGDEASYRRNPRKSRSRARAVPSHGAASARVFSVLSVDGACG